MRFHVPYPSSPSLWMVNGVRKETAIIVTTETSQLLPMFLNTALPPQRGRLADGGEPEWRESREPIEIRFDRRVQPLDRRSRRSERAESRLEARRVPAHVQIPHAVVEQPRR